MKNFKRIVYLNRKALIRIVSATTIAGLLIGIFNAISSGKISEIFLPTLIGFLVGCASQVYSIINEAKDVDKWDTLNAVFSQEGYSDNYVNTYTSLFPHRHSFDLAWAYIITKHYDKAEEIYQYYRNIEPLSMKNKAKYITGYLWLMLERGRFSDAEDFLNTYHNYLLSQETVCDCDLIDYFRYCEIRSCLCAIKGEGDIAYKFMTDMENTATDNIEMHTMSTLFTQMRVYSILGEDDKAKNARADAVTYINAMENTCDWLKPYYLNRVEENLSFGRKHCICKPSENQAET